MTKALSIDLRERVVAVIDGSVSRRLAARGLGAAVCRARSAGMRWRSGRALRPKASAAAIGARDGSRHMQT
jgi:hypothetical protein